MARDVGAYLAKLQRHNGAEYHDRLMHVEEQYGKRLWHQLTIGVSDLFNDPKFRANNDLKEFYEKFLSDFEHRYVLVCYCARMIQGQPDRDSPTGTARLRNTD